MTRFGEVPDADVESGHIVLPMRVVGDVPGCYDVPNLACQLVDASSASYSATRIACTVPAGVGRGFQVCRGIRLDNRACALWYWKGYACVGFARGC